MRKAEGKRFEVVSLSFNVGGPARAGFGACEGGSGCGGRTDCGGVTEDCNGPTCSGASCTGTSAPELLAFDARILVERAQLEALRAELRQLVVRFAR